MGEAFISYLITTTVFFQPLKYKRNVLVSAKQRKERGKKMLWPVSWGLGVSVVGRAFSFLKGRVFQKTVFNLLYKA